MTPKILNAIVNNSKRKQQETTVRFDFNEDEHDEFKANRAEKRNKKLLINRNKRNKKRIDRSWNDSDYSEFVRAERKEVY